MADLSTFVKARQAVVDVLAARAALSDVQVSYSWPGRNTADESIFTALPLDADLAIPVMRGTRQHNEETYSFDVVVQVLRPGGTVKDANSRALALAGELRDAIQGDVRLGLTATVIAWAKIVGWNVREGLTDRGAGTTIEIEVEVKARLS